MTQEEILAGNKLIAEFMGKKAPGNSIYNVYKLEQAFISEHDLLYNSYWDWLMPVVEKIESIYSKHHGYFGVHISSNSCNIQGTMLHLSINDPNYGFVYISDPNAIFDSKIESTWYAVVEFIKWYNNAKTD